MIVGTRLPRDEAHTILERSDRRPLTPATTWQLPALVEKLDLTARRGYAHAFEDIVAGDISLATAVMDANGVPTAAISISVSKLRCSVVEAERRYAPLLVSAAQAMSVGRGWGVPDWRRVRVRSEIICDARRGISPPSRLGYPAGSREATPRRAGSMPTGRRRACRCASASRDRRIRRDSWRCSRQSSVPAPARRSVAPVLEAPWATRWRPIEAPRTIAEMAHRTSMSDVWSPKTRLGWRTVMGGAADWPPPSADMFADIAESYEREITSGYPPTQSVGVERG